MTLLWADSHLQPSSVGKEDHTVLHLYTYTSISPEFTLLLCISTSLQGAVQDESGKGKGGDQEDGEYTEQSDRDEEAGTG